MNYDELREAFTKGYKEEISRLKEEIKLLDKYKKYYSFEEMLSYVKTNDSAKFYRIDSDKYKITFGKEELIEDFMANDWRLEIK
jgi:hypothetical protein